MSDVHWDGGQGEVVLARDTTGGVLLSTGVTICGILWPPTWSINNWFMIRGCKSKVWSWQSKEWGSWFPSQCPYWVYLCRDCTQVSGWLVLWMFQYFHCVTVSVGILIRKQETRSGLLSSTHRLPVTVQRVSGGFGVNRKTFIILVDFNFAWLIDGELFNLMVG